MELLVVIAILAGFIALLVPNFMQIRIKSRDMRRKSDLKAIQKALELHRQSQPTPIYPVSTALASLASNSYIQKIPTDPQGANYYYNTSDSNHIYVLCACLEDGTDPEGSATCTFSDGITASAPTCTGKYYKLNEP